MIFRYLTQTSFVSPWPEAHIVSSLTLISEMVEQQTRLEWRLSVYLDWVGQRTCNLKHVDRQIKRSHRRPCRTAQRQLTCPFVILQTPQWSLKDLKALDPETVRSSVLDLQSRLVKALKVSSLNPRSISSPALPFDHSCCQS